MNTENQSHADVDFELASESEEQKQNQPQFKGPTYQQLTQENTGEHLFGAAYTQNLQKQRVAAKMTPLKKARLLKKRRVGKVPGIPEEGEIIEDTDDDAVLTEVQGTAAATMTTMVKTL